VSEEKNPMFSFDAPSLLDWIADASFDEIVCQADDLINYGNGKNGAGDRLILVVGWLLRSFAYHRYPENIRGVPMNKPRESFQRARELMYPLTSPGAWIPPTPEAPDAE